MATPGDAVQVRLDALETPPVPGANLLLDRLGLAVADLEEEERAGREQGRQLVQEVADRGQRVLAREQRPRRVVLAHGPGSEELSEKAR